MKKLTVILLILALCLGTLCGCGDIEIGSAPAPAPSSGGSIEIAANDEPKGAVITLTGSGADIDGSGVSVSGSTVTIASPGSYTVSGTLTNGCIVVDTGEVKGDVTLTLKGADITCLDGAAIHVIQAKNFDLVLERDTHNRLVSGSKDTADGLKQDGAALFCEDDLDILGGGELEVLGYLNNGITCKDDLDIKDGTITVTAVNNGIRGSESVEIFSGTIRVTAGNDGIKTSSAKKEGKGFISIEGGTLDIKADGDGIAAETELTVSGGEIRVKTSGDVIGVSCKALKAKTALTISGGRLELDSEDHALHSAGDILISDGTIRVNSRDGRGVSAHGTLEIRGGVIDVNSTDDGIESQKEILISGGEIGVFSGEDGLKAGDKNTEGGSIAISGGSIVVNAYGDPIDAKSGAVISGGEFIGVGTSKTIKSFSPESTQRSLAFRFSGGAGTSAQVVSGSGEEIGTIEARCGYTCAIFSVPGLESGSYKLVMGTLSASASA